MKMLNEGEPSPKVVDTTLRDGEQMAGIELGMKDKLEIAKLIDMANIYQIEAGIPAMGGDEKKAIEKMMDLGLKSKISTWNRMNINDIKHSMDCGVDIIHISVPVSEIQIKSKIGKDKNWIFDNIKESIYYAKEKDFQVIVGFEDASRAELDFMIQLCKIIRAEGVDRVRYADTIGILYPERAFEEIKKIKEEVDISIGIHVHNDFGMAIANSIAAIKGGAEYVDCTFGGIGERTGNCDYVHFIKACEEYMEKNENTELKKLREIEKEIMDIIGYYKNE